MATNINEKDTLGLQICRIDPVALGRTHSRRRLNVTQMALPWFTAARCCHSAKLFLCILYVCGNLCSFYHREL